MEAADGGTPDSRGKGSLALCLSRSLGLRGRRLAWNARGGLCPALAAGGRPAGAILVRTLSVRRAAERQEALKGAFTRVWCPGVCGCGPGDACDLLALAAGGSLCSWVPPNCGNHWRKSSRQAAGLRARTDSGLTQPSVSVRKASLLVLEPRPEGRASDLIQLWGACGRPSLPPDGRGGCLT